jgi:hypothetical protein
MSTPFSKRTTNYSASVSSEQSRTESRSDYVCSECIRRLSSQPCDVQALDGAMNSHEKMHSYRRTASSSESSSRPNGGPSAKIPRSSSSQHYLGSSIMAQTAVEADDPGDTSVLNNGEHLLCLACRWLDFAIEALKVSLGMISWPGGEARGKNRVSVLVSNSLPIHAASVGVFALMLTSALDALGAHYDAPSSAATELLEVSVSELNRAMELLDGSIREVMDHNLMLLDVRKGIDMTNQCLTRLVQARSERHNTKNSEAAFEELTFGS